MTDSVKTGFRPIGHQQVKQTSTQAPADAGSTLARLRRPVPVKGADETSLRAREVSLPSAEPQPRGAERRDAKRAATPTGGEHAAAGAEGVRSPPATGRATSFDPAAFITPHVHAPYANESAASDACSTVLRLVTALRGRERRAVAEALAVALGGPAMRDIHAQGLADAILACVDDRLASVAASADFITGFLRGAAEDEHSACGLLRKMFKRAVLALVHDHNAAAAATTAAGPLQDGSERLMFRIDALALGAGGRRMSVDRMQQLLDLVDGLQRLSGWHLEPLFPEDLALAMGILCSAAGGHRLPAHLLDAVLGHVLSPALDLDEDERGCRVYRIAAAMDVWEDPAARAPRLLAPIAAARDLPPDHIGAMAWGLGLHLCGKDPEGREGWHEEYTHIVASGKAPPTRVVGAVMQYARGLPARSLERLTLGLHTAARMLGNGHARDPQVMGATHALRHAIYQACAHCSPEQLRAMQGGFDLGACAAHAMERFGVPAKDGSSRASTSKVDSITSRSG